MIIQSTISGDNYVEIKPVRAIFDNDHDCNTLRCTINDNLSDSCVISYYLMFFQKESFVTFYSSTCTMTGDDYIKWEDSGWSTEYVYEFVAKQKGLIII